MLITIKGFIKIIFQSIAIFLLLLIFLFFIDAVFVMLGMIISGNPASPVKFFIERFYPLIAAIILMLWSKRKRPGIYKSINSALSLNKVSRKKFFTYFGTSLAILFSSFLLSVLMGYSIFKHLGNTIYSNSTIIEFYISVWLCGNVLVAIGEEIIFRGFLINYITGISKSRLYSLLFVSLVFSTHHYPDFLNYAIAFLAGLATGYAYLKYKSLYPSIGIHLAYNIFNATIASESTNGPQLPYLIKFKYLRIAEGIGDYAELFIILGMLMILTFLYLYNNGAFKNQYFLLRSRH